MTATGGRTRQPAERAAPEAAAARRAPRPAAPGPDGPALLQALQRTAGNGAVTRTVQRLAAGAAPAAPVRPVGVKPDDDPRFLAVKGRIAGESGRLAVHPRPAAEARKAQEAAVAPADDKESQAKAARVDDMAAARPVGFDKAGFIAAVRQAVAAQAPRNLDEADHFAGSGRAAAVKEQVTGRVTEGKRNSAREIADRTAQPPDQSVARDKPVTPLRDPTPTRARPVGAGSGMPGPAPAEQTDLSGPVRETDATMASAGVTEQQLAESNEPQFTDALAAKKEGERHSADAPAQLRAAEARTLNGARQQAGSTGAAGVAAMAHAKNQASTRVAAGKNASKARDEAARAQISAHIRGVFDATKRDVDTILAGLDAGVASRFDTGEKAARDAFTADHKARMERYKDERYSGLRGKARWAGDLFTGLPAEANQIFVQSKALYESRMLQVISGIADFIGAELTRAKSRIAAGRAEIKRYVAAQPRELRTVAQEAAQGFAAQFDGLESEVDSKRDALVDDLASRYVEARNAVDDEIKTMQDENKGLWAKAKEAVAGAVETILKLKDMLLGVLARAAGAIDKIIRDPIGFLGNFVTAVKTGITNFAANIGEHLKKGLQGWLLGSLAEAGIELPEKFDLKGIVQLVLSLLGLTWANIRARIVRVIPEPVMAVLEKTVDFIQVIQAEGIGGLWKLIVDKVGDLKDMVMAQIEDFVVTRIVKAGITWLISLLNPAAAFIKACKMIYDVVMFFVEKASQIKEFVDSVLDSVESIASGGVGAVAGYIERTLSRTLPLVLGFLGNLLGLGGISDQIKKILQTVQRPVMSVVDKLIAGAVKVGKGLMGKVGSAIRGKDDKDESPEAKKLRLDTGMQAAVGAVNRFAGRPVAEKLLKPLLIGIKLRYRFRELELVPAGGRWAVKGAVNPEDQQVTDAKVSQVDRDEVKKAIAVAEGNQKQAAAEHRALEAELRSRGTASADKEADRVTIACGGGQSRRQGGGSRDEAQRDPAAARRWMEADAAKWGDLGALTQGRVTNMTTLTPEAERKLRRLRNQKSIDELLSKPTSYRYPGATKGAREEHFEQTGEYLPQRGMQDRGMPGATSVVHAEKLLYQSTGARAIGVSRDQCGDCQLWFKAQATGTDFIVVHDGATVRVFANGEIKSPADFD